MVCVGTAGWSISSQYKESFDSDGSHLQRYAQRLNAVEINSSFYRHHRVSTYRRWAESVPENFRFAVKVPRTLTHQGELLPRHEVLDQFAAEVNGLGNKLGTLLVQLPPKLVFDESAAQRFFTELQKRIDAPITCEPRHPSWGSHFADGVLTKCAVARVAADPPPWPGADKLGGYDRLAYFRWHGQPKIYYSDYNLEQLESLWRQLASANMISDQVWSVFDNTALGHALGNALSTMKASEKIESFDRSP